MAKCPFCKKILPDAFLKRVGASVMGRACGKSKARSNAKEAARIRWDRVRAKRERKPSLKVER